jgi:hypothetical protein
MAEITVNVGAPFEDGRRVALLRFRYDLGVVATVKDAVARARARRGGGVGGWLPDMRAWFVELACWSEVSARLRAAGHRVTVSLDDMAVLLLARIDNLLASPLEPQDRSCLENLHQEVLDWGLCGRDEEDLELVGVLERYLVFPESRPRVVRPAEEEER